MEFGKGGRSARDMAGADRGDQGGVKSSREQNSPGDIGHHATNGGFFKGLTEYVPTKFIRRQIPTGRDSNIPGQIPPNKLMLVFPNTANQRPGGELLKPRTMPDQPLQLTAKPNTPVIPPSHVQRRDPDMIPCRHVAVVRGIVQHETKHSA
mmetsp:Transcript_12084/g.12139  ORF Transcript_12084/g.12139 Transcript_12084/m.12139 type:complete len:151 (+) Transcript_12084:1226-1678(+)